MGIVLNNDYLAPEVVDHSLLTGEDIPEEEIERQAKITMKYAKKIRMEDIPEWMRKVYKNEYDDDDDYMERALLMEQLDPEILNLKLKYNDYLEWQSAVTIWEEGMDKLAELYTSREWVEVALQEHLIPNIFPPRPELKLTKKNRKILKNGFIPQKDEPLPLTPEEVERLADWYAPIDDSVEFHDEDYFITLDDMPKKQRKVWKKIFERQEATIRKEGIYARSSVNDPSLDAVKSFMGSMEFHSFDEFGRAQDPMSIAEQVEMMEQYEGWDEAVVEHLTNPRAITYVDGRIRSIEEQDQLEVLRTMLNLGYNVTVDMVKQNKLLSSQSQKLITNEIAQTLDENGPLTKAEKKAIKKMKKKAKKEAKRRQRASDLIDEALFSRTTMIRTAAGDFESLGERLDRWGEDDW